MRDVPGERDLFVSKSISEFDHVEICATTIATFIGAVEARIGIVLEPVAGAQAAVERKAGAHGPDDLKRPSEILLSELMIAEQGSSNAEVQGETSVATPQGEDRDK